MLFTVVIIAGTHVYFPAAVVDDAIHRFLVVRTHFPIVGKVISYTIGDDADGYILLVRCIGKHDAVNDVIQCAVTAYYNNGAVAVVGEDACQTLYRTEPFGLHIVVRHTFAVHVFFDFFPPFLHFPCSGFGVVYHSQLFGFCTHDSIYNLTIYYLRFKFPRSLYRFIILPTSSLQKLSFLPSATGHSSNGW